MEANLSFEMQLVSYGSIFLRNGFSYYPLTSALVVQSALELALA